MFSLPEVDPDSLEHNKFMKRRWNVSLEGEKSIKAE